MSRNKTICSIPRTWTLEDYRRHSCNDGSHHHVSRAELHTKIEKGLVVWLIEAQSKRESSVVYVLPEAHPGPSTNAYCSADPINTGLSNSAGEQLAMDFYNDKPYAKVMLADMRRNRETAPSSNPNPFY